MRFNLFLRSLIIVILSGACKKEAAVEVDENFTGSWIHRQDAQNTICLGIENDSKGFIEKFENGSFKSDTQRRKWLIKKNKLYFGWLSAGEETFSIDQYPTVATGMIINDLDTIEIGEKYMILDSEYYVD